jgi:hypothetical protein
MSYFASPRLGVLSDDPLQGGGDFDTSYGPGGSMFALPAPIYDASQGLPGVGGFGVLSPPRGGGSVGEVDLPPAGHWSSLALNAKGMAQPEMNALLNVARSPEALGPVLDHVSGQYGDDAVDHFNNVRGNLMLIAPSAGAAAGSQPRSSDSRQDIINGAWPSTSSHEGVIPCLYKDSLGKGTIGVGHLATDVAGTPYWSLEKSRAVYGSDMSGTIDDLDKNIPWWRNLDRARQLTVAEMAFQLGTKKFMGFHNAIAACIAATTCPPAMK